MASSEGSIYNRALAQSLRLLAVKTRMWLGPDWCACPCFVGCYAHFLMPNLIKKEKSLNFVGVPFLLWTIDFQTTLWVIFLVNCHNYLGIDGIFRRMKSLYDFDFTLCCSKDSFWIEWLFLLYCQNHIEVPRVTGICRMKATCFTCRCPWIWWADIQCGRMFHWRGTLGNVHGDCSL